jgi:uncharacterized membrane protein YbhN (UPF0104 family)
MTVPPGAEASPAHAPPRWARWVTALSIVIAVIAFAVTLWYVGVSAIVHQIRDVGGWFVVVIAIEIVVTACDAAALSTFVGKDPPRPGYLGVVRAQVVGRAINAVTPLASVGEGTKVTMLMARTPSTRAIAAVVRYNMAVLGVALASILIGAPVCAATLALPRWMEIALIAGAIAAVAILVAGALLIRRGMVRSLASGLARVRILPPARVATWQARLDRLDTLLRRKGDRLHERWRADAFVVASRSLSYLSTWVVLAATGHVEGLGTMAALATAGLLIGWISNVVPLGLGVAEGGNAALFAALGEDPALGVTVTLARRVIQLLYAALGLVLVGTAHGAHWAFWKRRQPAPAGAPAA